MLVLLIVSLSLVFLFAYSTIGVAVFKVRMTKPVRIEGIDCPSCEHATRRGFGCWHYENNQKHLANQRSNAVATGIFWFFVGLGLLVAKCSVLLAKTASTGPLTTGRSLAALVIGRAERTRGLEDRIAELESELGMDAQ